MVLVYYLSLQGTFVIISTTFVMTAYTGIPMYMAGYFVYLELAIYGN